MKTVVSLSWRPWGKLFIIPNDRQPTQKPKEMRLVYPKLIETIMKESYILLADNMFLVEPRLSRRIVISHGITSYVFPVFSKIWLCL